VTDAGAEPFRTRVGREKRARTRARILAAAFGLFDELGIDNVTIDHVRDAAGLSRGSFYNYFSTYEDMLKEMAAQIGAVLNKEQSFYFDALSDPAERICRNVQYAIQRLSSDPSCSGVLVRVTPLTGSLTEHMRRHADEDMDRAVAAKAIDVPSAAVAMDLGYGLVVMLIRRGMTVGLAEGDVAAAGLMLMRAYGVPEARARAISQRPLGPMPEGALRDAIIRAEP
jgi:AcrR family transcriptional regulator